MTGESSGSQPNNVATQAASQAIEMLEKADVILDKASSRKKQTLYGGLGMFSTMGVATIACSFFPIINIFVVPVLGVAGAYAGYIAGKDRYTQRVEDHCHRVELLDKQRMRQVDYLLEVKAKLDSIVDGEQIKALTSEISRLAVLDVAGMVAQYGFSNASNVVFAETTPTLNSRPDALGDDAAQE